MEKLVETGLELPAFSTLDAMASALRAEVNTVMAALRPARGDRQQRPHGCLVNHHHELSLAKVSGGGAKIIVPNAREAHFVLDGLGSR
ncbi:hypothetical protein ACFXJ8_24365 [Nonomuraea sp. NPDC059194]|uniref:hypothetical protein n=1 Tax=Nonomuraea sp. NPDC059194 TaxID=3346764 RepID=UPI003680A93E